MLKKIIYPASTALVLLSCTHLSPVKSIHESRMNPTKAFELLNKEISRCFPKDYHTSYKLDEIHEYQIKIYYQSSGRPADAIYLIKIKPNGQGSSWDIQTVKREQPFIEKFEVTKKLCR